MRHQQAATHIADGTRVRASASESTGHQRSGHHQCGHRHSDGLHGFDSDGHGLGPGADAPDRPGRISRNRHRRYLAAMRQAQLHGRGRPRNGVNDERRRFTSRQQGDRPVVVDVPKDATIARAEYQYPVAISKCARISRSSGGIPGSSSKRRSCCLRPSDRWSIPAAASFCRNGADLVNRLVNLLGFR